MLYEGKFNQLYIYRYIVYENFENKFPKTIILNASIRQ